MENEPSSSNRSEKKSPLHRIHSLDDVLNKDNDYIINYFATSSKTTNVNNGHSKKESSPQTTDEGFHSNGHSNADDQGTNQETPHNSGNKKKLLFSSHAQFSRDFSLDDGVEESIMLSEIDSTNEAKDGEANFQMPSVTNEVYVKICSTGNDGDKNGSK